MWQFIKALDQPHMKAALMLITAAAVVLKYFYGRSRQPDWAVTALIIVLAVLSYFTVLHVRLVRFVKNDPGTTYHYFLGGKYFSELGYYRLYRFTLLADVETDLNQLQDLSQIRHLEDYSLISRYQALALARSELPNVFTPERWEEFKNDWRAMGPKVSGNRWKGRLTDRGYNPPPFWAVIPGTLSQYVDADDELLFRLLRLTDLITLAVVLVLVGFLCGIDVACIAFMFLMLTYYNDSHQISTILQFMWLTSMMAAIALYRTGRIKSSAALFAASACLRIFPVILMAGPGVIWLRKLLKQRRLPKKETVFLATFGVACILFLLLGLTQGRGLYSTKQFFQNITMHKTDQQFDYQKFGLTRTMAEDLDRPFKQNRRFRLSAAEFDKNVWVYRLFFAALLILPLAAWIKGVDDDDWALPLGMVFIFAALVLSRYYYLAMVLFMIPKKEKSSSGPVTFAVTGLFLIHSLFYLMPANHNPGRGYEKVYGAHECYTAVNFGYLLFFLAFPVYLLIREVMKKDKPVPLQTADQPQQPESSISSSSSVSLSSSTSSPGE